jgi:hypothetical protein
LKKGEKREKRKKEENVFKIMWGTLNVYEYFYNNKPEISREARIQQVQQKNPAMTNLPEIQPSPTVTSTVTTR